MSFYDGLTEKRNKTLENMKVNTKLQKQYWSVIKLAYQKGNIFSTFTARPLKSIKAKSILIWWTRKFPSGAACFIISGYALWYELKSMFKLTWSFVNFTVFCTIYALKYFWNKIYFLENQFPSSKVYLGGFGDTIEFRLKLINFIYHFIFGDCSQNSFTWNPSKHYFYPKF